MVIAAGKGTRMYPLTKRNGKALLRLGKKPVVAHTVEKILRQGFSEVIIAAPRRDMGKIKRCLESQAARGTVVFLTLDSCQGTAKAVEQAANLLSDSFLVHYDDVISNVDLRDMIEFHRESRSIATLALVGNQKIEVGVASIDASMRILTFRDKPVIQELVNAAIYAFDKRALRYLRDANSIEESVNEMIGKGEQVRGYVTEAYWHHLKNPCDYIRINALVRSGMLNPTGADARRIVGMMKMPSMAGGQDRISFA